MGNTTSNLRVPQLRSLHAIVICALLVSTAECKQFNTIRCLNFLAKAPSNESYLLPGASANYVQLSYESCLQACGDETGQFDNLIPRLNTWLLPVLFLLANAQCPSAAGSDRPLRKLWRKAVVGFEALAHILGDPVDYVFSLLCQVETWTQSLELARSLRPTLEGERSEEYLAQTQNVAIILAAFERIFDHLDYREHAGRYFNSIAETLRNPDAKMTEKKWTAAFKYEAKIARNFVIVRTRHLAPAIVAVAFYAWQIVGAFVPAIGGSPNPSGGRVATALTLSWIVFMVLFGNTVGEVASRTAYADTIGKYLDRRPLNLVRRGTPTDRSARAEIEQAMQASLGTTYYTGYCYSLARQNASESAENGRVSQEIWHRRHSPLLLRAIAQMPILDGVSCALASTSLPPTYFSVRQAFFFGVGIMYHIISPALTSYLRRRWSLRAVRCKNAVIALLMVIIFIANGCGRFFNNCRGWYTIYPRGQGVVIYSKRDYQRNDDVLFPIIVAICVGTQISLCVVLSLMYGRGLAVMRMAEPAGENS
jgi:hypothetical protein